MVCCQSGQQLIKFVLPDPHLLLMHRGKVMEHDNIAWPEFAMNLGRQVVYVAVATVKGAAGVVDGNELLPFQYATKPWAGDPNGGAKKVGDNPGLLENLLGFFYIFMEPGSGAQHEKIVVVP